MGVFGGLVALFVFGVFIGTWWWYGVREMNRRAHAMRIVSTRNEYQRVVVRSAEALHDPLRDDDRMLAQ